MAKTPELDAAYRATTYRVFMPDGFLDLRIDRASPHLADWLAAGDFAAFALMTACNPGSRPATPADNARRQAELECDLLDAGYRPFGAEHLADAGDWPVEPGCFVPGLSADDALALGADYGQNAVVCGGADGVPRLLWIEEQDDV
ncbi:DUF3293 domain-containing protein [Azonexus sp.]|uniref:DUF3293 domain-containing protein n=1 Tax=Azonexus sp. TaxID=1872668 RepID=UPI0035AD8A19